MKIEKKRIRSLKFLERIEEIQNKRIGVILKENEIPEELKEKEVIKFRPNINWGKNSQRNTIGEYKINRDLPKINKYINTIEWHWKQYNGRELEDKWDFCDVNRNVYQKDFIEPFEIDYIFIKEKNVIYADLSITNLVEDKNKIILAINILLEKFGFCQILDESFEEYIPVKGFKKYNWEILPSGEKLWNIVGTKEYSNPKITNRNKRESFESFRITEIINKNPLEKYMGINEFQDYLVFIFKNVCILETIKYGNATYIITNEDWKKASMLTKKELLDSKYILDRVVHNANWKMNINKYF